MKNHKKMMSKGFTLIELIVVLVILAILAAILVPTFVRYIDKAKGASNIVYIREVYMASNTGLMEWKNAGSPGNSDKAYKINIENNIINYLDSGEMQSYTATNSTENSVQVALSLPSAYSQGWDQFIKDCKNNNFRNFSRVWVGKDPGGEIGSSIKAVYYISADGKYVSRIVYDDTTKLGSVSQKTGTYYEQIK